MTIKLNERYEQFLSSIVANGRFASPEEAVGAALRLLESEEGKFTRLAELLAEGASSPALPWDFDEFLAEQKLLKADREAA